MNRSRTTATSQTWRRALAMPLLVSLITATVGLATPAWAEPFFFSTGNPDGLLGALSQPAGGGTLETETADDFALTATTSIASATIFGLIPEGTPLARIENVEIEIYHVFPADSDVSRTSGPPTFSTAQVPTRVNSPADNEQTDRNSNDFNLTFTAAVLNSTFTALNSVDTGIFPKPNNHTMGDGPVTGQEVRFDVTFTVPIILLPGHYFFVPQVLLSDPDQHFLWLSAPKPIVPPGTPITLDLQSWIRNASLAPDW